MKILFLCPDYFGIYRIIEDGIRTNLDCELTSVIFREYRYKSKLGKIRNFISKTLLNKNLKKIWASKERLHAVAPNQHFDAIFVICPDFMLLEDLKTLIAMADRSIVYYWDSFAIIPRYKASFALFDAHFTFEPKDAAQYNMRFLTNFYHKEVQDIAVTNDVFFIGTLDERYATLIEILGAVKRQDRKGQVYLLSKKTVSNPFPEMITFIRKSIPFEESEQIYARSRVIVDVQKTIQDGLTFRVFEALGQHKKLITTNADIVNYDFYDPQNIFIWQQDTKDIPPAFFDTPYKALPAHIYKKYSLNSWINTIFDGVKTQAHG